MRVDGNYGGTPAYSPNSAGYWTAQPEVAEPPLALEGAMWRYDPKDDPTDDCFRAGGDSRWGFICDFIDMWIYAVPLGFLSAFVLKLPPMWVYFLICTDEFVKLPFVYRHYKSYKWLKNITREF